MSCECLTTSPHLNVKINCSNQLICIYRIKHLPETLWCRQKLYGRREPPGGVCTCATCCKSECKNLNKWTPYTTIAKGSAVCGIKAAFLASDYFERALSAPLHMDLFKNLVNKLFDKDEEAILNDCIAFDESGLVFTVFVRNELQRERLKFMIQEYLRQKQWFIRHTGSASMTAYQIEPDKRTMQGTQRRKQPSSENKNNRSKITRSCPSMPPFHALQLSNRLL